MDINFQACLDYVLDDVDPPNMPGVSQAEYNAWRYLFGLPRAPIKDIPLTEIVAIFRQQYWVPECPVLPIGLDYLFFDLKVKVGPCIATVLLQEALAKGVDDIDIAADGHFGVVVMAAVRAADPVKLNDRLLAIKSGYSPQPKRFNIDAVHDRVAKMLAVAKATGVAP